MHYCETLIRETEYRLYALPLWFFYKYKTALRKHKAYFKKAKKCITMLFVRMKKKLKATPTSIKEIGKYMMAHWQKKAVVFYFFKKDLSDI